MDSTTQTPPATLAALAAPVSPHLDGTRAVFDPQVWMRVCRPGQRCPVSGLSRSTLIELCVPGPRNGYRPPVEARRLKRKGAARGILIVSKFSLLNYIAGQPAPSRSDGTTEELE